MEGADQSETTGGAQAPSAGIPEGNSPTHAEPSVPNETVEPVIASGATSPNDDTVKITIIIPTNAYFMSGLRDFTMNVVRNMTGFSEQWAFRFQSVVDELVNNAIEFGSQPGKDVKITFLSQKDKQIEIFVEDTGTGPKKMTAEAMGKLVEERKNTDPTQITSIRGRGLAQIVANWTDVLEFKDNDNGGLTVHVVKHLEAGEQL